MHRLPPLRTAALVAVLALSAGCQTTYFRNRARDFGECFAVQAGVGPGLGVEAKAAGEAAGPRTIFGTAADRGLLGWAGVGPDPRVPVSSRSPARPPPATAKPTSR